MYCCNVIASVDDCGETSLRLINTGIGNPPKRQPIRRLNVSGNRVSPFLQTYRRRRFRMFRATCATCSNRLQVLKRPGAARTPWSAKPAVLRRH